MRESISVCMATFNGEKYIKEQIESIILQLHDEDEIIIVDDASTDRTHEVISSISDSRISLSINEMNLGVVKNFERAIRLSNKKYIFLADQDDIWPPNRLDQMLQEMDSKNSYLVSGNIRHFNEKMMPLYVPLIQTRIPSLNSNDSRKTWKNVMRILGGKANYFGCAMCLNIDIKKYILPFPQCVESHDLWIALAANLIKKNSHLEGMVVDRRVHGNNYSVTKRSFISKVKSRLFFLLQILILYHRIMRVKSG